METPGMMVGERIPDSSAERRATTPGVMARERTRILPRPAEPISAGPLDDPIGERRRYTEI